MSGASLTPAVSGWQAFDCRRRAADDKLVYAPPYFPFPPWVDGMAVECPFAACGRHARVCPSILLFVLPLTPVWSHSTILRWRVGKKVGEWTIALQWMDGWMGGQWNEAG